MRKSLIISIISCFLTGIFILPYSALAAEEPIGPPSGASLYANNINPGGVLKITGRNLPNNIKLTGNCATVITLAGQTDANNTNLLVNIPNTIALGSYNVTVFGANGSFDLSGTLIVTEKKITPLNLPRSIVPPLLGTTNLGELIGNIFNFSIQILGLIIFVIIVISGFQWLTAGGNVGTISKAQSRITQALLGAVILLASFLILKTINPDLIKGGSTLETINVPKGETIITEQEINPPLPQCNPACPTGQLCVIDSATNTASCRTNPGLLRNCDPMNPGSCPAGQTCLLDLSTNTATCR